MKQLVCEMCGSTDLIKDGGVFVCKTCGTKYSVEEAKKMMVEGAVEVKGTVDVKVDSSSYHENYINMAKKAYDSGNNAECEKYCNKILEENPHNYEALLYKGKSAGWQTTLDNNRLFESINAFASCLEYAPEEEYEVLSEEIKGEIINLSNALMSLVCDRFAKWPDKEEVVNVITILKSLSSVLIDFITKCRLIDISEFMNPIGTTITTVVSNTFINKIYPEYINDNDGYPSDFAFKQYMERCDSAISLLETVVNILDTYKGCEIIVSTCGIIVQIEKTLINACSYSYETVHVRDSWLDGSAVYENKYVKSLFFTENAKAERQKIIFKYEQKMSSTKAEAAKMAREEQAKKEKEARERRQRNIDKYWESHQAEKTALVEEKASINKQIQAIIAERDGAVQQIKNEKSAVSGDEEIEATKKEISSLHAQIDSLGMFKGKEKKSLQEQIEQLESRIKSVEKRMKDEISVIESKASAKYHSYDKSIEALEKRIKEIDTELTKDRSAEVEQEERLEDAQNERLESTTSSNVGDIIQFGAYSSGKSIEWRVIAKDGNKLLLITKEAVEIKPFNDVDVEITWEKCSLRIWLNEKFYNDSFGSVEKGMIQTTEVMPDQNPKYNTDSGNATSDKLFLLNISEANEYFHSDIDRQCAPSANAKASPDFVEEDDDEDFDTSSKRITYWLRTSGKEQNMAALIANNGSIDSFGSFYGEYDMQGVRPAMWVILDK